MLFIHLTLTHNNNDDITIFKETDMSNNNILLQIDLNVT